MRLAPTLLAAILGVLASEALAQETPEPPALELPVGARVRLRTQASGDWVEGVLAGADAATISLVPDEAPALGANRLRLPSTAVTRLEVLTGRKSRWLPGLVVGAAVGVAMGFDMAVDDVQCEVDDTYFCTRAGAVVAMGATSAVVGTLVGKMLKKDVWTPVALDALGPPATRAPAAGLQLQAAPGGMGVALSVRF